MAHTTQAGATREGGGDQHIKVAFSLDGGSTWRGAGVAVRGDGVPVWGPVLHSDAASGDLWLFYSRRSAPPPFAPLAPKPLAPASEPLTSLRPRAQRICSPDAPDELSELGAGGAVDTTATPCRRGRTGTRPVAT
jgi:hypothetical protein